jgi:hypothetical protein
VTKHLPKTKSQQLMSSSHLVAFSSSALVEMPKRHLWMISLEERKSLLDFELGRLLLEHELNNSDLSLGRVAMILRRDCLPVSS